MTLAGKIALRVIIENKLLKKEIATGNCKSMGGGENILPFFLLVIAS